MNEIVLADGRVLGIVGVTPAESMRLAEGTRALSGNRGWCSIALVVASIRSIDGIPRPFPTHKKHIEALLKDLDDDDIAAIREAGTKPDLEPVVIEFKKLSPYEILKVYEFAEEFNDVPGWFGPAVLAASVRRIGDKEVPFPGNRGDLVALVDELGLAGMAAASVQSRVTSDAAKANGKTMETAAKN